jgi:hypothetical protein
VLARKLGGLQTGSTIASITRMGVAGLFSVFVMLLAQNQLNNVMFGSSESVDLTDKFSVLIRLLVVVCVGVMSYLLTAWIFRVPEITLAYRAIRDKLEARVKS